MPCIASGNFRRTSDVRCSPPSTLTAIRILWERSPVPLQAPDLARMRFPQTGGVTWKIQPICTSLAASSGKRGPEMGERRKLESQVSTACKENTLP